MGDYMGSFYCLYLVWVLFHLLLHLSLCLCLLLICICLPILLVFLCTSGCCLGPSWCMLSAHISVSVSVSLFFLPLLLFLASQDILNEIFRQIRQ